MADTACPAPLTTADLVAYWVHDVDAADEARIEDHVFACDACARQLDAIAALGAGIRLWARRHLQGPIPSGLLARMQDEGLRIRRHHVAPGREVACTASADDDFVTMEFAVDLRGVERLDVVWREISPTPAEIRLKDVAILSPTESVWLEPGEGLRARPDQRLDVTFMAVDADGERPIATYRLNHTGFRRGE